MFGRTLLIVDDEECCRDVIADFFTAEQYKTHTAATSAEGIRLAEQLRPDFILLDYHLQGDTAAGVCTRIRSSEALKKTLIVILSGDETRREASYSECQADHFVLKGTPNRIIHQILRGLARRVCWERGIVKKSDIRLEAANFQVFFNSKPLIRLSEERFTLFSLLVESSPCFVKEDDIVNRVYYSDLTGEKTKAVGMLISRLRRDLGDTLAGRIQNQRGVGWAYVPPSPEEAGAR